MAVSRGCVTREIYDPRSPIGNCRWLGADRLRTLNALEVVFLIAHFSACQVFFINQALRVRLLPDSQAGKDLPKIIIALARDLLAHGVDLFDDRVFPHLILPLRFE